MRPAAPLPRSLVLLLAAACAQAVATIYYAQPLLDAIAASFTIGAASAGSLIAVTQIGYAAGLIVLVPLGDVVERRWLILALLALAAFALTGAAAAPSRLVLLVALAAIGLMAVVIQLIVVHAASLAREQQRGQVVGAVTSGVVFGLVMARALAGVVADLASWRAVYLTAAVTTLLLAAVLLRRLPATAGRGAQTFPAVLKSLPALYVTMPALRARALLALLAFAALSIAWSTLALHLTGPPRSLSHTAVGLFGLVGVAGAVAARRAGTLSDRGRGERTTRAALALLAACWLPLAISDRSLLALLVGLLALDVAVQAIHVTNQSIIYAQRPDAGSRLAAAYMLAYSIGTATGSAAATATYAWHGWTAVCVLGAAVSLTALVVRGRLTYAACLRREFRDASCEELQSLERGSGPRAGADRHARLRHPQHGGRPVRTPIG